MNLYLLNCDCSYGEENGWQYKEKSADYVLDPIDGTKSFITGTLLSNLV